MISDAFTSINFEWTFQQAENCGFEWAKENDVFVFSAFLTACYHVNKLAADDKYITIATKPNDIFLQCRYHSTINISKTSSLSTPEKNSGFRGWYSLKRQFLA
jgi:hypothetical protein